MRIFHPDDIDDECQHIPLNCPWIITSGNETLTVVIKSLKWTFNYDFWIRVTAYPEWKPKVSKQIDIYNHQPLLASLSEALNYNEDFPEPHLNSHQLHILGKLMDSLFWRYNPHNITMEVDPGMELYIIRMGPGETMETSLVLHRLKGETSHRKFIPSARVWSA